MKVNDLFETFEEVPGDNLSPDEQIFNLERLRYKVGAKMQEAFKHFVAILAQHPELVSETDVDDDGEWDEEEDDREYFNRIFEMPATKPNSTKFQDSLHYPAFNISTKNKKFYRDVKQALQAIDSLSEQNVKLFHQIEELKSQKGAQTGVYEAERCWSLK